MKNKWDERFMEMAKLVSTWSKDPSTKCGAVVVDNKRRIISQGFNGFPRGTSDDPNIYNNRPEKLRRVIHAEKNAILFASRCLTGCTLYVTPMPPCSQCAGMIIQSGISRVVTMEPTLRMEERWGDDIQTTETMFRQAGVFMDYIIKIGEINDIN